MTLEEWYERVEGGTSGDMVYSILSDWEKEICLARLGLMCEWTPEEEGSNWYQTDCKEAFVLNDAPPIDKSIKYCCYCGKMIKEGKAEL